MLTEEQVRKAIDTATSKGRASTIGIEDDLSSAAGLDSLDIYNVLIELEEITDTKVPDEDVSRLKTIRSMLDYFNRA
jgi:acyl carrier protein